MKLIEQYKVVPKYHFVGFVTIIENNVPFPKRVLSILKRIPITFCNELSSNIRVPQDAVLQALVHHEVHSSRKENPLQLRNPLMLR